jgi:hypothetical protein
MAANMANKILRSETLRGEYSRIVGLGAIGTQSGSVLAFAEKALLSVPRLLPAHSSFTFFCLPIPGFWRMAYNRH